MKKIVMYFLLSIGIMILLGFTVFSLMVGFFNYLSYSPIINNAGEDLWISALSSGSTLKEGSTFIPFLLRDGSNIKIADGNHAIFRHDGGSDTYVGSLILKNKEGETCKIAITGINYVLPDEIVILKDEGGLYARYLKIDSPVSGTCYGQEECKYIPTTARCKPI